jgi:hypothetical protein
MKAQLKKLKRLISDQKINGLIHMVGFIGIFFLCRNVLAADDLLEGTTTQAIATLSGSGRNWAYLIDGAISLAAFAKTKNPFVFFSVLGVALGITAVLKMAGA